MFPNFARSKLDEKDFQKLQSTKKLKTSGIFWIF